MTSTKATAAAVSGWLVTIAAYYTMHYLPGWDIMPLTVQGAFLSLIGAGIPWLMVYYAPANQHTTPPPPPPE